jgi:hypothetical protein
MIFLLHKLDIIIYNIFYLNYIYMYKDKYLKYKQKYLELKGGSNEDTSKTEAEAKAKAEDKAEDKAKAEAEAEAEAKAKAETYIDGYNKIIKNPLNSDHKVGDIVKIYDTYYIYKMFAADIFYSEKLEKNAIKQQLKIDSWGNIIKDPNNIKIIIEHM